VKKMWIFYRDRGTCVSLILINNSSVFISTGYRIYSSKAILIKKTWAKTNINEYNKLTYVHLINGLCSCVRFMIQC
jgi:hypothetical protein